MVAAAGAGAVLGSFFGALAALATGVPMLFVAGVLGGALAAAIALPARIARR